MVVKIYDEKARIIACATVAEELRHLGVPEANLTVLDFGLHIEPKKLKSSLQSEINTIKGSADILLGYGLCSYAVVGLTSYSHRLIIPRVDDCIALFLGSREEYLDRLSEEPGTYYLTKGWVEAAEGTYWEYLKLVERYGEKRALKVARAFLANYTRVALINTGNYRMEEYRKFARAMAEVFELRFEEIPGSNRLLVKMLSGDWGSEFVVVEPGNQVTMDDFMGDYFDD